MARRNPRFPLCDALRALAALSIFAYHVAFQTGGFAGSAARYLTTLNVGVPIFFVLSGFLLYRPFAQARSAAEPPPALRAYAIRRVLRIVPAYWVALVLIALWLDRPGVFAADGVIRYFGFLQVYDGRTITGGIGQAWTLGVELSFYAVLPLLAVAIRRRPVRGRADFLRSELGLLGGLALLSLAWKIAALTLVSPGTRSYFPLLLTLPAALDLFALGMAVAVLSVAWADARTTPRVVRAIERAPWACWVIAAVAFVAAAQATRLASGPASFILGHELKGVVAVALLAPAVWVGAARDPLRRALASGPVAWLARVSYGLYLWHVAVLTKLAGAGLPQSVGVPGYALAGLAGSLALAAVSWYVVERPALRFAHRPSWERRARVAVATRSPEA